MHRTEGENHSSNLFTNGPPGTKVEEKFLNAVQEELCGVVEGAGLTLKSASTDTKDQLFEAIRTIDESPNDNILINQDFSIWQENTAFTNPGNNIYTADGYFITKSDGDGTAPTINVKKNTTDMEVGFKQCCELEITNVGVQGTTVTQRVGGKIEDFEKYRGKTLTISIRVAASTIIGLTEGALIIWDGVYNYAISITSITTSYVTYSQKISVDDAATELRWYFRQIQASGTISTTGSIYIQWMKLELGSIATPLIPKSTGKALRECRRYCQKSYNQSDAVGTATPRGARYVYSNSHTDAGYTMVQSVHFSHMKSNPTVTIYDMAGNPGKVTMASGNNVACSVANQGETSIEVTASDGASVVRKLQFHYWAVSRL